MPTVCYPFVVLVFFDRKIGVLGCCVIRLCKAMSLEPLVYFSPIHLKVIVVTGNASCFVCYPFMVFVFFLIWNVLSCCVMRSNKCWVITYTVPSERNPEGNALEHHSSINMEQKRDCVYNTMFHVPWRCELVCSYTLSLLLLQVFENVSEMWFYMISIFAWSDSCS